MRLGSIRKATRWLVLAGCVTATILVAGASGGAEDVVHATGPDGIGDCTFSEAHNTAKILATPVATVLGGQQLNGTGGAVWFTGMAQQAPLGIREVLLVGPEGTEVGPVDPIGEDVIIDAVPLCHEGTWRLKEHPSNVTLTRFRTTTDADALAPDTVVLDRPMDRTASPSYETGVVATGGHSTVCIWMGDTRLSRDSGTQRTNVSVDYDVASPGTPEGLVTLRADGTNGTHLTTLRVEDWGNGSISVFPEWRSPGVAEVAITGWAVDDGWYSSRCTQTRRLALGPQLGSVALP